MMTKTDIRTLRSALPGSGYVFAAELHANGLYGPEARYYAYLRPKGATGHQDLFLVRTLAEAPIAVRA